MSDIIKNNEGKKNFLNKIKSNKKIQYILISLCFVLIIVILLANTFITKKQIYKLRRLIPTYQV